MVSFVAAYCVVVAFLVSVVGVEAAYVSGFDYADALDKSLLFFVAQRSGKLPANQRIKWRFDSALRDGYPEGVDLVGGYYDAGDHVKFGLPMAFSVTMLSWGTIEYRKEIVTLKQMGNTLDAIRWGTDYFIKAHPQPDVLWSQVGHGESDHYCWQRAEDMTTPRTAYKLDASHPGSDLAGETAAALASASIVFRPYDSSYADLLLSHAKQLFSFADRFRGFYDESIPSAKQSYDSSLYTDELLWAAAWLFHVTKDEYYLKYVADNAASMGGTGWAVREFSWDNKFAGVQILLSKVLLEGAGGPYAAILNQYQAKANYFACACLEKNDGYNVARTPGGLVYVRQWNNMQYATSAAFLLAVYSDYLSWANARIECPDGQVQPQDLFNFAKLQADYILGKNPNSMSYLVGYGPKYPIQVHHRGASIESIAVLPSFVGCVEGYETWYHRPEENPNVILGALVGGPNNNDQFNDNRSDYEQTEPTMSGSAPLIGLFARMHSICESSGSYGRESPRPYQTAQSSHKQNSTSYQTPTNVPVKIFHSITDTWTIGSVTYYRHKVVIKNTSNKPIADLKLTIEDLSGSLWGLSPTEMKNTYELPQWLKVLKPGSECVFVYVQGGPQAKVSIQSYH